MKLTFFFFLSLCLAVTCALGQNKIADSLYRELKNHPKEDTSRVNVILQLCYEEHDTNPEKNKQLAEEGLRISETLKYARGIGYSYKYMAAYYWVKGDFQPATEFAFKMLKVFEASGKEKNMADSYSMLGLIYTEWKNFDKAKAYYLKALSLQQKIGDQRFVAYSYSNLGSLCYTFSRYNEAMDYYTKAMEIRKATNDKAGLTQSYTTMASLLVSTKDYAQALDYFKKILPELKNRSEYQKFIVFMGLGEVYKFTGEYRKSDSLFKEALRVSEKLGNKKSQREVYHELMSLDSTRRNYKKALSYALLENAYQDTVFSDEKTKQIAEIEGRYETEKKEQAIQLLERDNEIKELWQRILIGSLVVVFSAGLFYYYFQRLRTQKNKQLIEAQEVVNHKLMEVDKMKSHFFASISHEFRTPLTLIKGPIEQLMAQPELPLSPEKVKMIHRNSDRLLQLVNQLLDLSKLDSGNLHLENKQGDVYKFLRVIASSFDSYAQQHTIQYTVKISNATLLSSFDHDKLEKVLYNLLFNAFKFTPDGGAIAMICEENNKSLIIEITDNGKGIAPQHLPHIFERFYQVHDHTEFQEGTGIGLSLVKELLTLMSGAVHVESKYGHGTTFRISIPLKQAETVNEEVLILSSDYTKTPLENELERHLQNAELEKETILVIEDNADMRSYIREHLVDDYQVLEAAHGKEGLNIANREIPDLIITDIMMPEMDGIAFCSVVRRDERTSHIPVVMLTAKEGRDNKIEGLETGADEYLTKPFDARELRARIKNLIHQRQQLRKKFSQQITLQPKNISITSVDGLFLEKVESTIEKFLSDYDFGVPQLQDALAMSKTQLHRKMKALTDQAPGEFLRNYRLRRAAQLLEQHGGNITDIAFAVGFGSLSYFTRSFKELFGKSPSEYSEK